MKDGRWHLFRRLLCVLGFHRVHGYPSDEFDVFMCRYCDWESDY